MGNTKNRKLRSGFTTGAAAAAAAKGALLALLAPKPPEKVQITFLTGTQTDIALHAIEIKNSHCAVATVIKDAGDDPDVTHKAEVGVKVTIFPDLKELKVVITGGKGVGVVTKPGLEIPPGQPAINPGPSRMITQEVTQVLEQFNKLFQIEVEVFVPKGVELAEKTLNARLGILGGLSILGTTGIERPMSHEAYLATISKALNVAKACGMDEVVLTTGRRSERFAQSIWPQKKEEAFIQIGDFFKASLEMAVNQNFRRVVLCIFFGKAVKMAQGTPHTHAARSDLTLNALANWSVAIDNDEKLADRIRKANTARHAFDLLKDDHLNVLMLVAEKVGDWVRHFTRNKMGLKVCILDYQGRMIAETAMDPEKEN